MKQEKEREVLKLKQECSRRELSPPYRRQMCGGAPETLQQNELLFEKHALETRTRINQREAEVRG